MIRFKWLFCALLLTALCGAEAKANTITAASCNTSDVQAAINSAAEGDTVNIPAGTCTWTSGVTISGKGITVAGAGSGRIIAYDNGVENLTVSTGALTMNLAGYSPTFSASSISVGETLRIFQNNFRGNWMQGTVTGLSGNTLTMNITSTGGNGTSHRWLIATVPSTVIVNNSSANLFTITPDSSVHTNWSGVQIAQGTGSGKIIILNYVSGALSVVIHECWIQQGSSESIDSQTNAFVVYNCSFDGTTNNNGQLVTTAAVRIKGAPASSWTTASTWGATDTTGQGNAYIENCDIHAYQAYTDNDDNGRMVFRYNLVDNSTFSTHGADTSDYGQRYFEYYENTGVFNGYSDGSTFNVANGWIGLFRGGSAVIWGNTLPAITSQDYGTKADVLMLVMNLQRNAGPDPCWGANPSKAGQYYHAPRQVGLGYVTGTGTANYPADGVNSSANDSITYVGDSEPVYIWGNSRQPLTNIEVGNYGAGNTDSCNGSNDSSAAYIVLNRDFFNGSTAKPGYTPYTYPHPLDRGFVSSGVPAAPASLVATLQ